MLDSSTASDSISETEYFTLYYILSQYVYIPVSDLSDFLLVFLTLGSSDSSMPSIKQIK